MTDFSAIYGGNGGMSGGIQSINGDTTPAQVIAGGTGISVATVAGTTTITNTGDVSSANLTAAGIDGIAVTGGTGAVLTAASIAQHVADSTHNGYLLSTDWVAFNAKQAAGNYITALTGDVTASGPGSVAATLATVNSNVGSFGSASSVATFTANGKGLITAAASTSIQIAESQVTNLVSDLAAKQSTTLTSAHILVGNGSNVATDVAVSGDLTLANTGAFTIANLAVTNAKIANTTIDLTAKVTGALPIGNGGTGQTTANPAFNALSPLTTLGDILTFSTVNARLAGNTTSTKNFLTQTGTGSVSAAPAWGTIASADIATATTASNMSDAQATMLGFKAYAHGTTYNGGNAPTITLSAGGGTLSSVTFSAFIPYQLQDGSWRCRLNIGVVLSSASRTGVTLSINGITFGALQAASCSGVSSTISIAGFVNSGASTIQSSHATDTTTSANFSGDFACSGKPSWAY